MVQSINIIHPEETLLNYAEDSKYKFNGTDWIKKDDLYIDRYVDKSIDEIDIDPSKVKERQDYYIEISRTFHNILLQSEGLKESVWIRNNISVTAGDSDDFIFPNNVKPTFIIRPSLSADSRDHLISQQFLSNLSSSYIFSTFIKDRPESSNHKIALIVKDLRYNVLLSAEVNLAENYTFTDDITDISVKFLDSNTYQEISGVNDYFSNYSAHIQRIKKNDTYYYRPYIKFNIKNNVIFSTCVIFLNPNGDYKYPIQDTSPTFFMSGAQLEEYRGNPPATLAPYMITYKDIVQNIIPTELYGLDGNNEPVLLDNKIYYLNDVKEYITKNIITPGTYSTVICTCSGKSGTVINDISSNNPALIKSTNGDIFQCIQKGTIPLSGSIDLKFRALEIGEIPVQANKVNKIVTKVSGWYSVNNNETGTEGNPEVAIIIKYIGSSKPEIIGEKKDDLALLQSTISFGTVSSELKNKNYPTWEPNKSYKSGDKVKYLSNLYVCITNHISSQNTGNTSGFIIDIDKWELVLDSVGFGIGSKNIETTNVPYGSIYYNSQEKVYKIKETSPSGDKWSVLKSKSTDAIKSDITHALTFNQGIFETWNQQSCLIKPRHEFGYNTGGNYNFVKLISISNKL